MESFKWCTHRPLSRYTLQRMRNNVIPLALLFLVWLSMNSLWQFPEQSQHLLRPRHADFYYSSSTRDACNRFDTLVARWTFSTSRFETCMDHLAQISAYDTTTTNNNTSSCELIHAYWKGPLPPTARLGILSILYTYRQDACMRLKLWVTDDETERELVTSLPKHASLEISRLNFTDIAHGIVAHHPKLKNVMEKSLDHLSKLPGTTPPVGFSDVVRVFVLGAYGGVYLDCDMLLLRRLAPLLSRDFYYRWNVRHLANTAIFHLRLGSPNALLLLQRALDKSHFGQDSKKLANALHPHAIYKTSTIDIQNLPTAYFDPLWVLMKNSASYKRYGLYRWDDFFSERNVNPSIISNPVSLFFQGAFTFHWHNQWQTPIVEGSTADLFLKVYEQELLV